MVDVILFLVLFPIWFINKAQRNMVNSKSLEVLLHNSSSSNYMEVDINYIIPKIIGISFFPVKQKVWAFWLIDSC